MLFGRVFTTFLSRANRFKHAEKKYFSEGVSVVHKSVVSKKKKLNFIIDSWAELKLMSHSHLMIGEKENDDEWVRSAAFAFDLRRYIRDEVLMSLENEDDK